MQAEITYTRDTGEKLVNETFGPNNIHRKTTGAEDRRRVEIGDGRQASLHAALAPRLGPGGHPDVPDVAGTTVEPGVGPPPDHDAGADPR